MAEQILKGEIEPFEGVTQSRRKDYPTVSHVRSGPIPENKSNRKEEKEAICMFKKFEDRILDYQIPLRERKEEYAPDGGPTSRGKIDLLMKLDGVLYLTELKRKDSPESLLRAGLEIETYCRMVDEEQLKDQYGCGALPLKTAVLLHRNGACRPYQEWMNETDFPHVHELLRMWGIQVFTVEDLFGDITCE